MRSNDVKPDSWHVCIAGWAQHDGEPSGVHKLWLKLGSRYRSPHTCVMLREWDADWSEVAELIWLTSSNSHPPTIRVYAYSWGAGYGFIQLARQLARRGLKIKIAVLADPVYRSRMFLFRWLAFVPWWPIHIPANVVEVQWTRQLQGWLRGHLLSCNPKSTLLNSPEIRLQSHKYMDDDPRFHKLCLEAAK